MQRRLGRGDTSLATLATLASACPAGDGIALNQVLSQLATDAAGQALPPASYARPPRKPRGICGLILDAIRSICKYLSAPVGP